MVTRGAPGAVRPLEPSVITGVIILGAWCVLATQLFKTDRRLLFLWLLMPVILIGSHVIPIIIAAGEHFYTLHCSDLSWSV